MSAKAFIEGLPGGKWMHDELYPVLEVLATLAILAMAWQMFVVQKGRRLSPRLLDGFLAGSQLAHYTDPTHTGARESFTAAHEPPVFWNAGSYGDVSADQLASVARSETNIMFANPAAAKDGMRSRAGYREGLSANPLEKVGSQTLNPY